MCFRVLVAMRRMMLFSFCFSSFAIAKPSTVKKEVVVDTKKIEVDAVVKKHKLRTKNMHYEAVELTYYTKVKNRNKLDIEGYSVSLVVIGKTAQNSNIFSVIGTVSDPVDVPSLKEVKTQKYSGKVMFRKKTKWKDVNKTKRSKDNKTWYTIYPSKAGVKYYASLVVLRDADGEVVTVDSSRSYFKKNYEKILNLKPKDCFKVNSKEFILVRSGIILL